MKRELVCIACPVGCRLTVTGEGDNLKVEGNDCPRGAKYGRDEVLHPTRMVTSSIPVTGGRQSMVSARTAVPVPKDKVHDTLAAIRAIRVNAPVTIGQVLISDAAGTGADVIATRTVEKDEAV